MEKNNETGWKHELARAIRNPAELLSMLDLSPSRIPKVRPGHPTFSLLVPRGFVARMEPGKPEDPLLRQVLPLEEEDERVAGYDTDPLHEIQAIRTQGLLQKYEGRALLLAASNCAVHCRYCFRRSFPYHDVAVRQDHWDDAIGTIRDDPSLREVILSGGDPLLLSDPALARLLTQLETIPHLRRVRIHSRLPIVLPERMTNELVSRLTESRLTPVLVVHANHPRELQGLCAEVLASASRAGIPVLNQAVLLRGVNDDEETLAELSERLLDLRVLPYYLHQLDRVAGAAHFEVSEDRGRALVQALRRRLPGYAVPRFVREAPGASSKVPLE